MLLKKKEKYTLAELQVRDLLLLTAREGGRRSRAIFGERMGGDYEDLTANVRDIRILQIPMGGSDTFYCDRSKTIRPPFSRQIIVVSPWDTLLWKIKLLICILYGCVLKSFAKDSLLLLDDPRIRLVRALNETQQSVRRGPAGPGEEKYIETLVVVDPKMTNFHGEDAAKQYALSACNIVSDLIS